MTSPNNTVISINGQSIVDANGNKWTIVDGRVAVNGVVDASTSNVIEMAFENNLVWQKSSHNLWWSKSVPTAAWQPPAGTAIDPIPGQVASANDTIVTVIPGQPTASITDASGNAWSISNGGVTLNGVVDPTTANVVELAYVNGRIWQENINHLWWSKTTPSDPWGPPAGTATNPALHVTRVWTGGSGSFSTPGHWTPNGVPQLADTAIVGSNGVVSFPVGVATAVNFDLRGGTLQFTTTGAFNIGSLTGSGSILIGNPGQTDRVVTTGIRLAGTTLQINEFVGANASFAIHGSSTLSGGATLAAQLVGTASLPRATLENDGTMTVSASTLSVGMLNGYGAIEATGGSTLNLIGASATENIHLLSAHLNVGGGPIPTSTGMQFLASVTDFGAGSAITFANTQATSEVFQTTGATAGQLILYNGTTMVADFKISGQAKFYASNVQTPAGAGSVLVTAYDTGHSIPIVPVRA
jgi:hypothetical protein